MPRLLTHLLAIGSMLFSATAGAQPERNVPGDGSRAPVLIAVVDTLPDFRIIRLPGESVRQAVLLPSSATPEMLTEALETLRVVWARDDDRMNAPGMMMRRVTRTAALRTRIVLPWAERVLHDLRDAHRRRVPGVGDVRAVQIWLAPLPAGAARQLQEP